VEVAGHRLPRTFTVRTPSGGLHLYLHAPDRPLGNTAGKLGRRIDTRGAGEFVVGPESVCRGRYYTIMDCSPIEGLPEWIIDKLLPAPLPASRPSVQRHQDHYLRAISYREAQRVRTAAPGLRNNALNVAAFILGQLVGGAELSESEARTILWQAVRLHLGVDGVNTTEAERTITSGLTAGTLRPRLVRKHS
jgi:Bifunctional DNA primase/polymerase, N-terminal